MTFALADARNIVDQLFASPHGRFGPLTRHYNDQGRELLPGVLYQFQMESENDDTFRMQLYKGLGGVGRELWQQERRALDRLSDLGHPHLPRVRDGGEERDEDIAWVLTNLSRHSLDVEGAMGYMAQHPLDAFEQLIHLTDAISQMHGRGLFHRNIWPGTIEVAHEPDPATDQPIMLRLARFEMSTLIFHLLRELVAGPAGTGETKSKERPDHFRHADRIRPLYIRQGLAALDGCPPERLAFLYNDAKRDALEDGRSDIYSLGMLAYRWFIDPVPEDELEEVFLPDRCDWSKFEDLQAIRRRKIEAATKVPRELASAIRRMLRPQRGRRPTHFELLQDLTENHADIAVLLKPEEDEPAKPYRVFVLQEEYSRTFFKWGWTLHEPSTAEGWEELRTFLEDDLRGGVLVYSEDGYLPYGTSSHNELRQAKAKYVLMGRSAAYFSSLYEDYDNDNPFAARRNRVEVPEVLQIRFPLRLDRGGYSQELRQGPVQLALPELDFHKSGPSKSGARRNGPSWTPLLKKVKQSTHLPTWRIEFERSLTWLLEVHQAELDLQKYPFELAEGQKPDQQEIVLRWNETRDNGRLRGNSLLDTMAKLERRADFGDFFDGLDSSRIVFWSDKRGAAAGRKGEGYLVEKLDAMEIRIQRTNSVTMPRKGWIQPEENRASYQQLERQRDAKKELFKHRRGLAEQLNKPRSMVRAGNRWQDAGRGLKEPAPEVVKQILAAEKLYAVHGPPGTGKTTVATRAIESQLREDPSQRILVTSQSHFSLDNMAERILSILERHELLAVRVASVQSEAKVSPRLKQYLPRRMAETRVREIERYCAERIKTGNDSGEIRRILGLWKSHAGASIFEIMRRARRGANLVFATCGAATSYNLQGTTEQDELFDWVIVEEAARAWPTELAIPLVRGQRWTLIGDHFQLPAFGRERLEILLDACAASPDQELSEQTRNREALLRWFDLFRHLFDPAKDAAVLKKRLWHPHGELTTQFRMREPIADLISKVFYAGKLDTDSSTEKDHGITDVLELHGESLLWLDTSETIECFDRPRWRNDGEAHIVARLVRRLRYELPGTVSDLHERLAILTPYWDQIYSLYEKFGLETLDDLKPLIHTVDSFQGKEADIVILSLVRGNEKRTPTARLGHLVSRERVNVMLSRGRRLLILVGSRDHFADSDVPFWNKICRRFPITRIKTPGEVLPFFADRTGAAS